MAVIFSRGYLSDSRRTSRLKCMHFKIMQTTVLFLVLIQMPSATAEDAVDQAPGPMEEITVIGDKSLLQLEQEYIQAEDNFFDAFNALVDDWRYEIVCDNEAPTGTRIKLRTCRSRHQMELQSEEGKSYFLRGHNDPAALAAFNMYDKNMRDRIAELADENPRLLEALIEYRDKYKLYSSEGKRRCPKMIFVCIQEKD